MCYLFFIFFKCAQILESELSRVGDVLTADVEKAKQLLNSADEDLPVQIHKDLALAYRHLEPNFTAVSQMCAEKKKSLTQAMEEGRVSLVRWLKKKKRM